MRVAGNVSVNPCLIRHALIVLRIVVHVVVCNYRRGIPSDSNARTVPVDDVIRNCASIYQAIDSAVDVRCYGIIHDRNPRSFEDMNSFRVAHEQAVRDLHI